MRRLCIRPIPSRAHRSVLFGHQSVVAWPRPSREVQRVPSIGHHLLSGRCRLVRTPDCGLTKHRREKGEVLRSRRSTPKFVHGVSPAGPPTAGATTDAPRTPAPSRLSGRASPQSTAPRMSEASVLDRFALRHYLRRRSGRGSGIQRELRSRVECRSSTMRVPKGGRMLTTFEDALKAVAQVGPIAREYAQKSEDGRRLAPEVLDAITEAGLWGAFSPLACSGAGLSGLTELFEINRAMAYEDTSAGWALLICGGGSALAGARMTDQARKEIFSGGCVPIAGVFNPGGAAAPADGGVVLNGRWPFASGITYAHWVIANAIALDESGVPMPGGGGLPEIVTALLRRDEVEIIDDWHVAGLRGTGSMTFAVQDHFVPAHRTFAFFGGVSIDEPKFKIPVLTSVGAYFAGIAVGLAQRAVDSVIEL